MLGACGTFVVALSVWAGRQSALFYFLVVATATAAWSVAATTFGSFMAAQNVNGFFQHRRARRRPDVHLRYVLLPRAGA